MCSWTGAGRVGFAALDLNPSKIPFRVGALEVPPRSGWQSRARSMSHPRALQMFTDDMQSQPLCPSAPLMNVLFIATWIVKLRYPLPVLPDQARLALGKPAHTPHSSCQRRSSSTLTRLGRWPQRPKDTAEVNSAANAARSVLTSPAIISRNDMRSRGSLGGQLPQGWEEVYRAHGHAGRLSRYARRPTMSAATQAATAPEAMPMNTLRILRLSCCRVATAWSKAASYCCCMS